MVVNMLKCSTGLVLKLKHASSLSEIFLFTSWQHPDRYFLTFQLGFGSFLGIIGAHLIENKRQMVRGFVLPLCIEITLTCPQSESTGIKPRLSPQPPPQSLIILLM